MPLPQMTTRRWMIAVAVVALSMGGIVEFVRLKRRSDDLTVRAQDHARRASFYHLYTPGVDEHLRATLEPQERSAVEDRKTRLLGVIAYHEAMARKYDRAARYPWLPVEPDPPEPE
jgi:hypothetical protein